MIDAVQPCTGHRRLALAALAAFDRADREPARLGSLS